MPTVIQHRRVRIVTLENGESIAEQCRPKDIALTQNEAGWWVNFVGEDGTAEGYDAPFESYNKALWTAKAAAEFESHEEP